MTDKSRISTVLDGIVRRSRRAAPVSGTGAPAGRIDRAENIVQSIARREAAGRARCVVHDARRSALSDFGGRATALNFVGWSLTLNRVSALRETLRLRRARA